jgi:hypothetical protein
MDSVDDFKALIGAWTDAVGTILSAYSEMRAFVGLDEYNNQLVAVGEGLQALGTMVVGTTTEDAPILFVGNWIDGTGAATSSYAAYLRQVQGENEDNVRLEILGDSLQALGSFFAAFGEYLRGEDVYTFASSLQSLGAVLEAIAGNYELANRTEARLLALIGSSIQALGSNLFAIAVTKELLQENKED